MNKYKTGIISLTIGIIFIFSCKKSETDLNIIPFDQGVKENNCIILQHLKSDGTRFDYTYKNNLITNISGFIDFDSFVYNGNVLKEAVNSNDKNYKVLYEFDKKELVQKITFEGTDSQNKPFVYPSVFTYNSSNRIELINLHLPIFKEKIQAKFTYDQVGNIKDISVLENGTWNTLLENTSFDDKNSPYKNQRIGKWISYYMVYILLVGGDNHSQFINQNNVKTCKIKFGRTFTNMVYNYDYNINGYPIKATITKTKDNRVTTSTEGYAYNCSN